MSDAIAGKKIKCPNCQAIIQTPSLSTPSRAMASPQSPASSSTEKSRAIDTQPVVARAVAARPVGNVESSTPRRSSASAPTDGIDLGQLPLPPLSMAPSPSAWQPTRPKKNKSEGLSPATVLLIAVGGCGLLLCAATIGLVAAWWTSGVVDDSLAASISSSTQAPSAPSTQVDRSIPFSRSPRSSSTLPRFPELGAPQNLGGVDLYQIDLATLNSSRQPGHATQFRVYVPANMLTPRSLACVLVAPAGTTMLHGNELDSGDYHDETLPYARAGMVVVQYSLDGPLADMQSFTSERQLMQAMNTAYTQFRAAEVGVTNGRIALEFALAKLPQVDPARIYCAGHSSAATLALQLAVEEPRIAKCAAYAPATNLNLRLKELLAEPALQGVFPDLTSFISQYSPYSNAHRISCPVFLFHARDDSNEPWSTTNAYASQLKKLNKNATFVSVDRGDHYQPMISSGIPKAIEWFQQQ